MKTETAMFLAAIFGIAFILFLWAMLAVYIYVRLIYQRTMFRQLAQELDGKLFEGPGADQSVIHVVHNNRTHVIESIKFDTFGSDGEHYSAFFHQVTVQFQDQQHHAEIFKKRMFLFRIRNMFNRKSIAVEYKKFGQKFTIKSNHPDWIKSVLNRKLMDAHLRQAKSHIFFESGRMSIIKPRRFSKTSVKDLLALSILYADAIAPERPEKHMIPQLAAQDDVSYQVEK